MIEIKRRRTDEVLLVVPHKSLENLCARDIDLTGADFRGAYMPNADLSGSDCAGADLSSIIAAGTSFIGADLRGADLGSASLAADFRNADCRGADFTWARVYDCDFRAANLRGTVLDPTAAIPPFEDKDLNEAGFELMPGGDIIGYVDVDVADAAEPGRRIEAHVFSHGPSEKQPGLYVEPTAQSLAALRGKALRVRAQVARSDLRRVGLPRRYQWRARAIVVLGPG